MAAKELTAKEALDKLNAKTKEVALLEAQLKVQKLRNVQLEANNRMLMLLLLGLCVGCGIFAYDARVAAQLTSSSLSTSTSTTSNSTIIAPTPAAIAEEECDLVVHYDTKYGAGVYAGMVYWLLPSKL